MSKNLQDIADYFVYFIAGIGAIFIGLRKLIPRGFDFQLKKTIKNNLSVQICVDKYRLMLDADRVDVITTSNGGGIPKPGSMLYASLFAESVSKRQEYYLQQWQQVPCDYVYLDILHKAHINNYHIVDVSQMNAGVLTTAVQHMDIDTILFTSGFSLNNKFYYLVVSWNDPIVVDEHIYESVRIGIAELKRIITA